MTTTEFIQKSKSFEKNLVRDAYKVVSAYAGLTLISEISNRVIQNQLNAKGQKFGRYSTKPSLSSGTTLKGKHVWNKLAGTKSKRSQIDWVTIKEKHLFVVPGGYAEIRRLSGELNIYKNFFWTGEMWKKFGITQSKLTKDGFRIRLAGKSEAAQNKIEKNTEREGINIIDASKEEEKQLGIYVDQWLQQQINKYFK